MTPAVVCGRLSTGKSVEVSFKLSGNDIVDAVLRLLEILSAWPVILLLTLLLFRRQIGQFINEQVPKLLERVKHAELPGGIVLGFEDGVRVAQDVVNKAVEEYGNNPSEFRTFVVEQTNKLPEIASFPPSSKPNLQGCRVLWVDDTPTNNTVERNIMERLGTTITLATSTDEALNKIGGEPPYDAIISDMGRREDGRDNHEAGYDLLERLRKSLKSNMIPFIIYAGWNAPSPDAAQAYGAFGSTSNPLELLQLVSSAVNKNPKYN